MHRIQTYLEHISPSPVANKMSGSLFEAVQAAPVDPIFGIQQAFVADPAPKKYNFGVGAYRTDEGKPLVLKTVKKVNIIITSCNFLSTSPLLTMHGSIR